MAAGAAVVAKEVALVAVVAKKVELVGKAVQRDAMLEGKVAAVGGVQAAVKMVEQGARGEATAKMVMAA